MAFITNQIINYYSVIDVVCTRCVLFRCSMRLEDYSMFCFLHGN